MTNPKINIEYNRFLDPIFIAWIQTQPKHKDWKVPEREVVLKKVQLFRDIWRSHGDKILTGFTEATGLGFVRNHIDINIVSGNPREFSFPIVLRSRHTESEFIESATHELIHCLFKDNRISEDKKDPYPKNPHILVHALLKYTYLDVLNQPNLLAENISHSSSPDNREYSEAWDFVEKHGYQGILASFKESMVK